MSNFDFIATYVDLSDSPTYTTNITLEGQLLKISFVWNERIGKRTIFIRNSADICYLQNTILHPNESFELNSNAVFDDLPYKVVLQKVGDTNKVGNIYNWSKDFILCFYRTVDIETEKLNVKYGVTAPSTPTLPKPFGNWVINQGYELVNEEIKYTAYKTNGVSYYDSFADFDLVTTLVRSFHDSDLQQYVAFTAAVEQLIGSVDWDLDPKNNTITYKDPPLPPKTYTVYASYGPNKIVNASAYTALDACILASQQWAIIQSNSDGVKPSVSSHEASSNVCSFYYSYTSSSYQENLGMTVVDNPVSERPTKTIPLSTVATQIIDKAESSPDEILKLLSQDYINLVAESIFNTDTSKQFVNLEDLVPQLENNKVLRSLI